jgi:hypothetical protein
VYIDSSLASDDALLIRWLLLAFFLIEITKQLICKGNCLFYVS